MSAPAEVPGRQEQGGRGRGFYAAIFNLLIVCAATYLLVRAVLLAWSNYDSVSIVLACLLLLAEGFVVLQSVAYALDVGTPLPREDIPRAEIENWDEAPSVAVLLPARHEPRELLDETLVTLHNLDYPNKTIYLLDDSSEQRYKDEAAELARQHGVELFRRAEHRGAKAGMLNDCLENLEEKYIAVFDADQEPLPQFLKELVRVMEANDKLAFAQCPQFYTNMDASLVSSGANLQHCMFYEHICEGKAARGAMMCCGTNFLLRREAIEQVGGFDENVVTEDFSTTLDLLVEGWESVYYNHVLVFGEGPETLPAYLSQQHRWASGNLSVLKKVLRYMLSRPGDLKLAQWWEFLVTGSYYLTGVAYLILMICPISYIIFRTPTFFMEPAVYLLTFVPYFSLSVAIFFASMGQRNYSFGKLLRGLMLGFTAVPVHIRSAVEAALNIDIGFRRTPKGHGPMPPQPMWTYWPQILLWVLNYVALVWGANLLLTGLRWPVVFSMIWVTYHFFIFSGVFYFQGRGGEEAHAPAATD